MSKTISKHHLVAECNPAFATDGQYKYEVVLKKGYRFSGWETHFKHVTSTRHFTDIRSCIERCPKDCPCGEGE